MTKQKWLVAVAAFFVSIALTACSGSPTSSGGEVKLPNSPAGQQLKWLISAIKSQPLSTQEIAAHFNRAFLSKISPARVNSALEAADPTRAAMAVFQLTKVVPSGMEVHVQIGSRRFSVSLAVDPSGLIQGLLLTALTPSSAPCANPGAAEPCYTALQLQQAYDLKPLYARGLNGSGVTIVVLAGIISPTIVHDVGVFDQAFGLRTPSIRIVTPSGPQPRFNPASNEDDNLASEMTGDVESAHAIAPGANIVVLVAPPGIFTSQATYVSWQAEAVRYAAEHELGQVVTSSLGNGLESALGATTIDRLHQDFQYAAAHHVSVIHASGDKGSLAQSYGYPSTDPLVTAVGGTRLHLDAAGNRTAPDSVFNDPSVELASGGGLSSVFSRPSYQDNAEKVVGDHRGGPDVSMSGDFYGGFEGYESYDGDAGWHDGGGTSVSAPLFSGIAAIADQAAGHPLGPLNPYLYHAYQLADHGGLVPVTSGNSTITIKLPDGSPATFPGYVAIGGYNLATGLGTIDADKLVMTLARQD